LIAGKVFYYGVRKLNEDIQNAVYKHLDKHCDVEVSRSITILNKIVYISKIYISEDWVFWSMFTKIFFIQYNMFYLLYRCFFQISYISNFFCVQHPLKMPFKWDIAQILDFTKRDFSNEDMQGVTKIKGQTLQASSPY